MNGISHVFITGNEAHNFICSQNITYHRILLAQCYQQCKHHCFKINQHWTHWGRGKLQPFRRQHFKSIFLNKNVRISLKISLKFVPNIRINNIPALVQIMAWLVHWRIYASLAPNELRTLVYRMLLSFATALPGKSIEFTYVYYYRLIWYHNLCLILKSNVIIIS